jgi:hypothetical protein
MLGFVPTRRELSQMKVQKGPNVVAPSPCPTVNENDDWKGLVGAWIEQVPFVKRVIMDTVGNIDDHFNLRSHRSSRGQSEQSIGPEHLLTNGHKAGMHSL